MGCCSCKYLCENKLQNGKVCGSIYYCSKLKQYVNGASDGCEKYEKDYLKKSVTRDEIYNNGVHYCNEDSSGLNIVLIIGLLILGCIMGLF